MDVLSRITSTFSGTENTDEAAPDALTLIHADHEEASALFKTALDPGMPSAVKKTAIAKVCFALTVHADMEEKLFYPALRKAGKSREKSSVLEAAEEHACVKDLIAKIKRIKGRDETLEAKVTVLKELVEHHVKEEESEIFDEARKVLGTKLKGLGEEMQRFKDRAGARNSAAVAVRKKGASPDKSSTSRKATATKTR
jgi:hemerythrin-like domain-containing protein